MTSIDGFIDDYPCAAGLENVAALDSQIAGSIDDLLQPTEPFGAVLAVGRQPVVDLLAGSPVTYPVLVHPDATIGPNVHLAEGVVVAAGSRLSANIQAGRHSQIDQNAAIGLDCALGDFSRLSPQAWVSAAVTSGRRAMIGANAIGLQELTVADDVMVGAAAMVTHCADPATTVVGVPAA